MVCLAGARRLSGEIGDAMTPILNHFALRTQCKSRSKARAAAQFQVRDHAELRNGVEAGRFGGKGMQDSSEYTRMQPRLRDSQACPQGYQRDSGLRSYEAHKPQVCVEFIPVEARRRPFSALVWACRPRSRLEHRVSGHSY